MSVPWQPRRGQLKAVKFLLEHSYAGLLLDPGEGKTSICYAAFSLLQRKKLAKRALVVVPLRPMGLVWPQERDKWDDFKHLQLGILHSDYGSMEKTLYRTDVDVFLINPEGLRWLFTYPKWEKILAADVLIIDEVAKFKHTNTGRFKLLKPELGAFKRRWGLTGTPAPNGYLDLFGQALALDRGAALGQFITHYRRKYFLPCGFAGTDWKLAPGAEVEIQKRLKPLMFRLEDKDKADIPQVVEQEVWVQLPPAARKVYDAMEEEMFAEIAGQGVMAVNGGAASIKCRQICNGGVYAEQEQVYVGAKRPVLPVHTAKVSALDSLVEELSGQHLLVAYQFQHDVARLEEGSKRWRGYLGSPAQIATPYIGGGVGMQQAEKMVGMWNRDQLPWLFVQPESVSHGLNLQQGSAQHIAWFGLTWKQDDYDQLVRRLRRPGSKHRVIYVHHILCRDTLEVAMLARLKAKDKTQAAFLAAMQGYAASRGRELKWPGVTKKVRR